MIHLSLLKTTGSVARVPAPEIETLVLGAARDHLGAGAVEYMYVRGRDGLAICSNCAEGAYSAEEALDCLDCASMDILENMGALKIELEQLVRQLETHRREGLCPEAEQASSVTAQQHLEAVIAELDAMLEPRRNNVTSNVTK